MVAAAKRINGKDLGQNANANIILMGKINRVRKISTKSFQN